MEACAGRGARAREAAGRGGFPLCVAPSSNQVLWFEIYTGRGRPAGRWKGTVSIRADANAQALKVVYEDKAPSEGRPAPRFGSKVGIPPILAPVDPRSRPHIEYALLRRNYLNTTGWQTKAQLFPPNLMSTLRMASEKNNSPRINTDAHGSA